MQKAIVVGKIVKPLRVPEWRKPLKFNFGSLLRTTLSAKRIPVNHCGR